MSGVALLASFLLVSSPTPGQIVERVPCAGVVDESYAAYLPSNYTLEKKWPILLALDPAARGRLAVEKMSSVAEEYGYIVVASNNARNGPMEEAYGSLQAMWFDALNRFSVDDERIYLTGFSGGVRVAGKFAQLNPRVSGVIGCGAGFELIEPDQKISFPFVGVCGNRDMNLMWLQTLNAELLNQQARSRVVVFQGEHRWPPSEVFGEALQWMELDSYRRGKRPVGRDLIESLYKRELSRAARLEKDGRFFKAYLVYLDLRADFDGLMHLGEVERRIDSLSGTEKLRRSWQKTQQLEQDESRLLKEILAEFLDTKRRRTQEWWQQKIHQIKKLERRKPKDDYALIVIRLLDSLWRNGYERAWLATLDKDYQAAVYFAQVAVLVQPQAPEIRYNFARMNAFAERKNQAFQELRKAIDLGFNDLSRIRSDAAFRPYREEAEFLRVVEPLGSERRTPDQ